MDHCYFHDACKYCYTFGDAVGVLLALPPGNLMMLETLNPTTYIQATKLNQTRQAQQATTNHNITMATKHDYHVTHA